MTTTTQTPFVVGTDFEGYEQLVHPPKQWILDLSDGRKVLVSTLEDDIDGCLMIADVWDFDAGVSQDLLDDPLFRAVALSAIESKIRELNLDLLNDLVRVLIKEDRDEKGEEGYPTILRRYAMPDVLIHRDT